MEEVNPFDEVAGQEKNGEEKFYLVQTPSYSWTMTQDISDDNSEPFYDMTGDDGSRLFTCETDCPICGARGSLMVCALL